MTDPAQPPRLLPMPDGSALGLTLSRFDERQRLERLRLPTNATCWDYAPLIDVVRYESELSSYRFTGRTASEWLNEVQRQGPPEGEQFKRWYEAFVQPYLPSLERRARFPDNHYCIELATPPLTSSLPHLIRALGLKRASAEQWLATLLGLAGRGVKQEELDESGVLAGLRRLPAQVSVTQCDVLRLIDLSHVLPKFSSESRFGFAPRAGWREVCQRIPSKDFKRRGLWAAGHGGVWFVIRYRHRSLGWSIVRSRFRDLLIEQSDLWCVLDEQGCLIAQTSNSFESAEDAMAFAELQMSQRYAAWGKDQALTHWERFSLPGSDNYQEILLQLDDWAGSYRARHYRTRNVLVHVRSSIRCTEEGRRVLFLDEVQSDWHADLRFEAKSEAPAKCETPLPDAPFRKEWPLLAMKLMLWWAQRLGVDGLAWSTAQLQAARWHYGAPEALYRVTLPEAGKSLAKALSISLDQTRLLVRTQARRVDLGKGGWTVCNRAGVPITKPFRSRKQAEYLADQTGDFVPLEVPVLWTKSMPAILSIPLYGVGGADQWFQAQGLPIDRRALATQKRLIESNL